MQPSKSIDVLFLGSEADPVHLLLRGLEWLSVRRTADPSEARAIARARGAGLVVSVQPLDDAAIAELREVVALVLLGEAASADAHVALRGTPPTAELLELALRCALERSARGGARRIVDAAPVGIVVASTDGAVTETNPAFAALLGYSPSELVGSQALAASTKGSTVRTLLAGKGAGRQEVVTKTKRLATKDGTTIEAEVSATLLAGNGPTACLRTVVDVTARQRAFAESRQAQDFLGAALHHMPVVVLVAESPSGSVLLANGSSREVLGETPDLLTLARSGRLQREDGSVAPPEELPFVRTLADGQPHRNEALWLAREQGGRAALCVRSAALPLPDRPAVIGTFEDLTELRIQDQKLRAAERRYGALFEQANDAMMIATETWLGVVEANPAAHDLFGFAEGELPGRSVFDLAPREQPGGRSSETILEEAVATARAKGVARLSLCGQRRDGAGVELEVTLQPLSVGAAPDLVLIRARDASRERVIAERLRQAEKLEAIALLASGIAQDFNNILTGVLGFVELAERTPTDPEKTRRFLREARRAARRAVEVSHRLLGFGGRSWSRPKLMDLNESVERAANVVSRLLPENMRLSVTLAKEGCPVTGVASELEQAILALALHARESLPRGGTLRIETQRYHATEAEARALGVSDGDHVVLVVTDDGAGMPDSVKARLFEPFFGPTATARGSALGLAMVHGVVRGHGGVIHVDSTLGEGTRFTVVLPLVAAQDLTPSTPGAVPLSTLSGTGSVLVVDEDRLVRDVTAAMLEALGYRVVKATTPVAALAALEQETFDVVVVDDAVSDQGNGPLAKRIRADRPRQHLLVLSGRAREPESAEAGALVLTKPLTLEMLGRAVQSLLREPG